VPYQEAIGSLMYLAMCTHPDISFAMTYLSQLLHNEEVFKIKLPNCLRGSVRVGNIVVNNLRAKLSLVA
jgi:hypothetical protein